MNGTTIAEFFAYLKNLDVQVFIEGAPTETLPDAPLEGDRDQSLDARLRCTAPEGTLTTELRQELVDRKAELISFLHHRQHQEAAGSQTLPSEPMQPEPMSAIQPTAHGTVFPLSFAQQRLWFLDQLAPDNAFYNVPAAIRLKGSLDHSALERSFNEIVRRHSALRTTFTTIDGQPVQVIAPSLTLQLPIVNLQAVAVPERDRLSQQLAIAEAQRPFNLLTDPLLRVTLLQFDPTESILLLTLHHIVADGWSLGVLIRELACFYTALIEGRTPALPALPIQYTDFACWQRQWLQGEVLEKQLAYWRSQLQDLAVLQLPSDRPRPLVQTYQGATYPLQLSPTLTQALATLSQQSGGSLFMTLLAAFQTLLYRYTGQEDIAIGSPIANRHRSEVEGLIGFFVNSLVLRSDLSGNPTFCELLERVREVALEAYSHQDLPFEKLVEALDPDRDLSRNPLFQVAFALQNAPIQALELPGLTLEPAPLESGSTRFDLEVHLWEPSNGLRSLWQLQEGLSGFIAYSTDLFDRDRIGRLVGHFQTLLEGIVGNPNDRLSNLPLLTSTERQQLVKWHQIEMESNDERCFHQIFEAQVQAAPTAIALVAEHGSLTYGELNQQANQLAQSLQQMGVRPNDLVGLCVDRSPEMVIGILGILKAGGAYVPLDPKYPRDRLHFMLTDTQVTILLTQSWLVETLPESQAQFVCLDQVCLDQQDYSGDATPPLETAVTAENLAYIIYTSGSTGTPKGVLLTHRGLCNVVKAQQQFHLSRESRILQFSSLSFDASIFELALALGCGGTLYIPPQAAQLPGMALIQFLQANAITHALLTPAALAVLPAAVLPALQVLITGGEACSSQVVDRWAAKHRFFNAYGPTETTIWATVAELHPGDHPLTIGHPIAHTQVYILDAALNPVPIGIPGELYIGGKGLARGYLNRPELTAEKFIQVELKTSLDSSLIPDPSSLYKTGDRARYHTDGTIEFLGRIDTQIKLRGFRVELGEIEATLQRHPAIQAAVVVTSGATSDATSGESTSGASAATRLIAYFSLDRQHLQAALLPFQTQQLQHWQTLYNQTYQSSLSTPSASLLPPSASPLTPHASPLTPHFNTTGWNSSYTGEPVPLEEMQEWVDDRVQQILALKPRRVLEIGCGTGLLLFQIAPHCQAYVGTDFSAVSLVAIQQQLESLKLPQVKLLQRQATDFEGIEAAFDVVILNSIVQYFPNQTYLMQVLEQAIQVIAPGGVLFIGDVRSLPLLTAFHTWMKFSQAEAGMERAQLRQQVERSRFEEPELAIDPAFFHTLRVAHNANSDRLPHIQQVQIRLSRGRSENEMVQFRYNVLLHLEDSPETQPPLCYDFNAMQRHNWSLQPLSIADLQQQLCDTQPDVFVITNVANRRVKAATRTVDWLFSEAPPKTVGRLREILQSTEMAIDPQAWWDLEKVLPYRVELSWSMNQSNYDVILIRHGVDGIVDLPMLQQQKQSDDQTNEPLQSLFARQLMLELRPYLGQTLPDYMIPSAFVPLEALPLTPNGKVDRRALLFDATLDASSNANSDANSNANSNATSSASARATPQTPTELTLTAIWQELLRLKQVNLHDNFFALGGHSLLATQMTSRVRDAFGLELPLKSVFEAPTIAQLSPVIEALRATTSTLQAPPLVRLDRAAHRRVRSSNNTSTSPQARSDRSQPLNHPVAPDQPNPSWSPLVPLTLGQHPQPFFCVHPMFGVVFPYLELAHQLGGDRSFYGLQPLGLDGKHAPLNRIEAIAASYIQAMQTIQPQGPYFLGGWSFGGLVAFEMAQQLTQVGQSVALLAMLDTPAPVASHQLPLRQSLKFLGMALWSILPFLLDYGAIATHRFQSLQRWNAWFSRWQWSAIARLLPESRLRLLDEATIAPMLRIVYANSQAVYRYVPQPYAHRITLFKAAEQPDAAGLDPTLGWKALAQDIQLHQVSGNHLSLLQPPHVQSLAQQLRPYLT